MSGIRQFRRRQVAQSKREAVPGRFRLRDYLLVAGVLIAVMGALLGWREYDIYLAGRPERISNSGLGTSYVPAIAPGDPGRRASALAGFAVAGIGAGLSVLALSLRMAARRPAPSEQGDVSEYRSQP